MLQTQTIDPGTLSVLKTLMQLAQLKDFALVGGTALALKYGHRKSIDLDLFSVEKFDNSLIIQAIGKQFGKDFQYEGGSSKWGVFGFIQNIKVDIVYYPQPLIGKIEAIDTIRFYSDSDLIAMKLQAILGRGVKKDFWDIAQLLQKYSLKEMMDFHTKKYPNQMLAISLPQALVYFSDAEKSESPVSLNQWTWENVKGIITQKVREYLNF